jgi:2-(1,2-epoxy-1,2-dihydrophenyl)acetyl-CoA isomerase
MKHDDLLVLDYTVNNGVARIALDRTAARNAMNQDVADELYDVAQRVSHDRTVRAVLFVGNGKVFSVGGDIEVFASTPADELPETLTRMAGRYHDALRTFARLDVPIVAAVHGAVAGGALGLIYTADIVLAAEGTKFATGFAAIGLSGDGGNSWFLPRLVGTRRAAELYFEDRVLDAREAADWGLVTRVVSCADLTDHADSVARRLASGPTKAYGAMRQLFWQSSTTSLADHLADEVAALGRVSATTDTVNAVASFTNKQQPTFEGK